MRLEERMLRGKRNRMKRMLNWQGWMSVKVKGW